MIPTSFLLQRWRSILVVLAASLLVAAAPRTIILRGSIVGTRLDLQESLDFAGDGKVKATISTAGLDDINAVFDRMRQGQIEGRVVLDMTQ